MIQATAGWYEGEGYPGAVGGCMYYPKDLNFDSLESLIEYVTTKGTGEYGFKYNYKSLLP